MRVNRGNRRRVSSNERFMTVARIAAALAAAFLAALASPPAWTGGPSLVARAAADPLHGHRHPAHDGHRTHLAHPLRHADQHRAHHGHHLRRIIATHAPRPIVVVPTITFIPQLPLVQHYAGPAAAAAAAQGAYALNAPAFAVDGDTFDAGGVRYRLAGIDAPELHEPNGYHARARLQQLLSLGQVTLIPLGTDVYGRVLVEALVGAWNVSGVLRAEGYGR